MNENQRFRRDLATSISNLFHYSMKKILIWWHQISHICVSAPPTFWKMHLNPADDIQGSGMVAGPTVALVDIQVL